jgi:hypothetical protein
MRVFLSYSTKQRDIAERIAVGLHQIKVKVFFDRESLPAGEEYDARIRREVQRCDLFVFLISPDSISQPSYARTELGFASKQWPSPSGRVLPVVVVPVENERAIPPYLAAVTILHPKGNIVAEVVAEVQGMQKRWRHWLTIGALAAVAALIAAVLFSFIFPRRVVCSLAANVQIAGMDTPLSSTHLTVTTLQKSESFVLNDEGLVSFQARVAPAETWTIELVDPMGVSSGRVMITGCPSQGTELRAGDGTVFKLRPR